MPDQLRRSWWLYPLRGLLHRRRRKPRIRVTARPRLEALEDRWLPSTITVTTTTDVVNITSTETIDQVNTTPPVGGISLRDAVIAADNTAINAGNPSNTINLPAGTYNLTLTNQATDSGDGSDLLIAANQDLILDGTGTPANTTIHQTVAGTRIFETEAPETPTTPTSITFAIDNVTLDNGQGQAFGGGAILAGGIGNSLTLSNCAFTNNQSSNPGGAIENFGGGSLTVTGCTFSNNMTTTGGGGGGAIDFTSDTTQPGSLSVSRSTFDTNTATDAAGGGGGAIQASAGSGTISITTSNFVNNQVVSSGVGGSEGSGGAIYHDLGVATVQHNRFVNNSAEVVANGNTLFQQTDSTDAFTATDNWWGQNSGPAAHDLAGGTITATTYLQLEISPTSATLAPTQTQLFTADIRKSSGGGRLT